MLIIRRLDCIDAVSSIVTLSKWPSGAQVERELNSLSHTKMHGPHNIKIHTCISSTTVYGVPERALCAAIEASWTERKSLFWSSQRRC